MIKKIGPGISAEMAKEVWINMIERKGSIGKEKRKNPLPTVLSLALRDQVLFETHQSVNGVDFVNPEYPMLTDMRRISNRVFRIMLKIREFNILGYFYYSRDGEYNLYFPLSTNLVDLVDTEFRIPTRYKMSVSIFGSGILVEDKAVNLLGVDRKDVDIFTLRNKLSAYFPDEAKSWSEFVDEVSYTDLLEYEAL